TIVFTVLACLLAPLPGNFKGVFNYVQELWGCFSPGIVAVFVFGLVFRRAPTLAAMVAMIAGVPVYLFLLWKFPQVAFLNDMAITFAILIALMAVITAIKPLKEPVVLLKHGNLDLKPSKLAKVLGCIVLATVAAFYIVLR